MVRRALLYTRAVRNAPRSVILAGIAATALISVLGFTGALRSAEWWTQDARMKYARRTLDPLSDKVKLVAIDDRALDTIGRWPWSRETLALALDEIARAGAKCIAIDLLFNDAQSAAPDEALAASIGRTPTVLAVNMDEGRLDPTVWSTADGGAALQRLVDATVADITADSESIATRAQLDGIYRDRFLERASSFKKLAAWKELLRRRKLNVLPPDAQSYVLALTRGDTALGRFPDKLSVLEAFERDSSFGSLARFMGRGTGDGSPMDAPPRAVMAAEAGAVGFVNSKADPDGQYRRVRPFWGSPYGAVPQMGLAAGMLYLGVPPIAVDVERDALVFPDGRHVPLEEGNIVVAWPTSMFEPVAAAGETEVTGGGRGVVAIGRLVDLARNRTTLLEMEARYKALSVDIAALQGLAASAIAQVPVDEKTRAAVKEQGEFLVGDLTLAGTADLKDLTDDERRTAGLYREWWRLDGEIPKARGTLGAASVQISDELGGRVVFVGWMATGVMADMINTLYGPRTPGVYFHAAVADMIISAREVYFWPPWSGPLIAILFGLGSAGAAWRVGAGISTGVTLGLAALWVFVAGGWVYATYSLMLPVAVPVIAAIVSQAASVSAAAIVNQRERARITRQFRARVSSQLVDMLAGDPDAVSMRGSQRMSTILFGDLAGFTTISEKLGSEAVVATLNMNMGAMTRELTARRAYVNKFLGDGIMAFWSAFGPEPDQAQLAIEACRECQRAVQEITRRPERADLPPISLRLGVATGVVTIGDCGAPPDLNDYTVIGDSANLAARLESANKQFGTAILFDGNTRSQVRDTGGLPIVPLGRVVVVGQSIPIELFTLLVEDPEAGWIESIGVAVDAFARGDFAACEAAWAAHEARFGATKIAKPFREAMHDPEDLRDGVLRLRAK